MGWNLTKGLKSLIKHNQNTIKMATSAVAAMYTGGSSLAITGLPGSKGGGGGIMDTITGFFKPKQTDTGQAPQGAGQVVVMGQPLDTTKLVLVGLGVVAIIAVGYFVIHR